jgi:hypothetical protein
MYGIDCQPARGRRGDGQGFLIHGKAAELVSYFDETQKSTQKPLGPQRAGAGHETSIDIPAAAESPLEGPLESP